MTKARKTSARNFETAFRYRTDADVTLRILNCQDCGGALTRSPLLAGGSADCTGCGAAWRLTERVA